VGISVSGLGLVEEIGPVSKSGRFSLCLLSDALK